MKIAIYSRKSKFTEKGESIDNQIRMCREYAENHFGIDKSEILVYEDEGFSGGNTARPQFQLMLQDAKSKRFDTLMCYRLDRISRNIADFSSLVDQLEKFNISFISIREQFDTTTPMGKAMMYIASVFAQLERDTIAERIRDNMLQLAKLGRWLGKTCPLGYQAKQIEITDRNGNIKKASQLVPVPEEIKTVELIYNKYLELNSLAKLETYIIQNDIKTKKDAIFTMTSLRYILQNTSYVKSDSSVYKYLTENGYKVCADEKDFDGSGLLSYSKSTFVKNKAVPKDHTEWIIAPGKHEGIISSETWLKVQEAIQQNKSKKFRKIRNLQSLLSGVLKCSLCGSYMRPRVNSRPNKNGETVFYYMCEMKEASRRTKCNVKNINGIVLDQMIIDEIIKIANGEAPISTQMMSESISINQSKTDINNEITKIENILKNNDTALKNLIKNLEQSTTETASKYIFDRIEEIEKNNVIHKDRLLELRNENNKNNSNENNMKMMTEILNKFPVLINTSTIEEKRKLIRSIVNRVTWDGQNINLELFSSPADSEKKSFR